MANKLLILGAAMAHKNKGYNLSTSISKAVDDSLKLYNETLTKQAENLQKRIGTASLLTQGYLDKLEADPEIDLLDKNLADEFTKDLADIRNKIGLLNMARFSNPEQYAPGTEQYTNINAELKRQEELLKKRLKEAKTIQTAKGNWINEFANISETWKMLHPEKFEALTQILNSENPNYTHSRDENGDLVLTTVYEGKEISVKVDELDDWEEYPQPEISKINEFYELAHTAGKQNKDLPISTLINLKEYLKNFIGNNQNALFSLMFDDLPIGDANNKMPFFSEKELIEFFDTSGDKKFDINEDVWTDNYNFKELRDKVVNRIIERVQEENKKMKPKTGFLNDPNLTPTQRQNRIVFSRKVRGFNNFMSTLKNKSNKEILNAIANNRAFMGYIDKIEGNDILFKESSVDKSLMGKVNLDNEIKEFKRTGDASRIFEILYLKTSSRTNIELFESRMLGYENLTEEEIRKYLSDNL